ncbi:hypothetical protein [Blastococcus montanus]|uniref:hypothetical protein n=1 Tax=Blastococcus montanus TaxID=3144973 RepID=UPI003209FF1D
MRSPRRSSRTSPNTVPARSGTLGPATTMSPNTVLTVSGPRVPTISARGSAGRSATSSASSVVVTAA